MNEAARALQRIANQLKGIAQEDLTTAEENILSILRHIEGPDKPKLEENS